MTCGPSWVVSDGAIVVADAGPLISLAHVGQLEVLRQLHDTVCIPPEVAAELARHRHQVARMLLSSYPRLTIRAARQPLPQHEQARLDPGESFAMALALELSAPLLIDERAGRRYASQVLGLEVRGMLGTLVRARRARLVGPLSTAAGGLARCRRPLRADLIEETHRAVGEG